MPRWPTAPSSPHRTGCYGCKRLTPADGGCGVHGYPCTHWGVDTFTGGSRDVFAPEDGTVVAVSGDTPPFAGYGPGIVLLKGKSGFYHLLAHLELGSIKVTPGIVIVEGAPIGRFDAAHAHCHYEVRRKPTGPSDVNTIDPVAWLKHAGGSSGGIGVLFVLGGLLVAGYFIARSNVFATKSA
jgi:murein DD-endopeptidase MepM/ murein hydrolase activator NlpD